MGTGLISIGVSGIAAAQYALLTTEHNVVNANTPGYSRQAVTFATNVPVYSGAGTIGQGVHVVTVNRVYNQVLTEQVNSAQTSVSSLESYYSQIQQIDTMLADPNAGLSPALQDFFAGAQSVASNPSLLPARQSMISIAETLVARFQSLDMRLSEISAQVEGRIASAVDAINAYASEIAVVNQQITISEASSGHSANDLLDQRDLLVNKLNGLVRVTTTTNDDGSYNVFIGNGQQLVIGGKAMEMSAEPSLADPTRLAVGMTNAGSTQELPESMIVGGELGGLLSFRRESLNRVNNELGRVAASLALTFNAQHALGQDLFGNNTGDPAKAAAFVTDFFGISDPKWSPNDRNQGNATLDVQFSDPVAPSAPDYDGNFYTELSVSDYRVVFSDATNFSIYNIDTNQVVTTGTVGTTAEFDGLQMDVAGGPVAGDSFVIRPLAEIARNISVNTRISADPRLVAAAAPLTTSPAVSNTGSMTLSQGVVGVGYSLSGLPFTLSAVDPGGTGVPTALSGVAGTWSAVYSDSSTPVSGTGNIPLFSAGGGRLSLIKTDGEIALQLAGTPAVGDSFEIRPNDGGVEDGRNAVLFAKLQTQNTVAGGTATFQAAYARMVSDNGVRTREASVRLEAQTAVLTQATSARDSVSAVNLDEEAANMIKFQQAYQAASKVLEIGSRLFETILSIG